MSRALRVAVLGASWAIVLAAVMALGVPAGAHHNDPVDANDTVGLLDVRTVLHGHLMLPRSWTIVTYPPWTTRKMWDAGYLLVYLDTVNDTDMDYYALVRSTGRHMSGTLWKIRTPQHRDRFIGPLRARHPTRRSVGLAIPFGKLSVGPSRTTYRWFVLTIFHSNLCPKNCFDRVPDVGAVVDSLSLT
jgi:hypothetical protein